MLPTLAGSLARASLPSRLGLGTQRPLPTGVWQPGAWLLLSHADSWRPYVTVELRRAASKCCGGVLAALAFAVGAVIVGATSGMRLRIRRNWVKTLLDSSGPAAVARHVSSTFLEASLKFRFVGGRPGSKVLLMCFF